MIKHIVLLRFAAVMQSWGAYSLQTPNSSSPRNTETLPVKSSLIGLIRCALGLERGSADHEISDLEKALINSKIWVREDSRSILGKDYQVARSHHDFTPPFQREIPKNFLQDGIYLVLLEVESAEVANKIVEALNNPAWATYVGRRAHVPVLPECIGYYQSNNVLEDLRNIPAFGGIARFNYLSDVKRRVILPVRDAEKGYPIVFKDDYNNSFHPLYAKYLDRVSYLDYVEVEKIIVDDRSPLLAHTESLLGFVAERNSNE